MSNWKDAFIHRNLPWADVVINLSNIATMTPEKFLEHLCDPPDYWEKYGEFNKIKEENFKVGNWSVRHIFFKDTHSLGQYCYVTTITAPDGWRFVLIQSGTSIRLFKSEKALLFFLAQFSTPGTQSKVNQNFYLKSTIAGFKALQKFFNDKNSDIDKIQEAYEEYDPKNYYHLSDFEFIFVLIQCIAYGITDSDELVFFITYQIKPSKLSSFLKHDFKFSEIESFLKLKIEDHDEAIYIRDCRVTLADIEQWLSDLKLGYNIYLITYLIKTGWTIPGLRVLSRKMKEQSGAFLYVNFVANINTWARMVSAKDASLFLQADIDASSAAKILADNQPIRTQLEMIANLKTVENVSSVSFIDNAKVTGLEFRQIREHFYTGKPQYQLS